MEPKIWILIGMLLAPNLGRAIDSTPMDGLTDDLNRACHAVGKEVICPKTVFHAFGLYAITLEKTNQELQSENMLLGERVESEILRRKAIEQEKETGWKELAAWVAVGFVMGSVMTLAATYAIGR